MRRLFVAILAFLFRLKSPFHKDKPRGVYRMLGEIEEPELSKPVVKEKSKAAKWLHLCRERLSRMSYDNFLNQIWKTLFGLGVVGASGGILFLVASALFSKGNVDYCYIDRWTYIKETTSGVNKPDMAPGVPFDKEKAENKIPGKEQTIVLVYELKGHRNWREDRNIGRFDTFEAAIDGSHKLNCAVEAK